MAVNLGDTDFAETCTKLFNQGRAWTEKQLFNGEYFRHIIQPPAGYDSMAPGLTFENREFTLEEPEYQLGNGCLVDQLVGQFMAHICNLGYLAEPNQISKALDSILKYNYRDSFHDHFNNMRSYVLGDEAALLMASFPQDRPKKPFSYFSEVMTGFEYTAAIGMLYEGKTDDGIRCIQNIRARYDGRKRSPFDEAECGHHYARAMASWGALLALTGFHYSAITQTLEFAAESGFFFWSNGYAWGTVNITADGKITVQVKQGQLTFQHFILKGHGEKMFGELQKLEKGDTIQFAVPAKQ
jgi:uncharacterized protein (DUF608 family)